MPAVEPPGSIAISLWAESGLEHLIPQVPPLMQQRGHVPPDMHTGGELLMVLPSGVVSRRRAVATHILDLAGLPPDLHEALQTAQRQADSYIVRSAKLAAVGGVDYAPPAGMLVQLPPMRKVGVRRSCVPMQRLCSAEGLCHQVLRQSVHLVHGCRWM